MPSMLGAGVPERGLAFPHNLLSGLKMGTAQRARVIRNPHIAVNGSGDDEGEDGGGDDNFLHDFSLSGF